MGLFGNTLDSSNHESPVGMLGAKGQKWTDPLAWLPGGLGTKWVNLTSHEIPKMTNEVISPVTEFGGRIDKAVNPVRRIPAVDNVMNTIEAKPADAIGTAVGAYFAAPVIAGAFGSGGAGAAGGAGGPVLGGTATGTGVADVGGAGSLGGGSLGALGSGTFDTTAAYASPLTEGLGTGTAGAGMGASGTATSTLGAGSGMSSALSPMQAQLISKALGNLSPQQQQTQPAALAAANGQAPQASITAGPTLAAVNPAVRQQMAQLLMRGAY